jgi:hypothetical protein
VKAVESINLNGIGLQYIANKERTLDEYRIDPKEYMSKYEIDDLIHEWKEFDEQGIDIELLR